MLEPTTDHVARAARRKVYGNIVLPAFLISIIAYLDRNNLSYATLTMREDLQFSQTVYGLGAGIFFAGYFLFEIPGALIAQRTSPRIWLARIMISWGILTALMAWVTNATEFYILRFLIGAAEASLYPVLYATVIPRWFAARDRARAIAIMLSSLQVSAIIGAPLAAWLIDSPFLGMKGWQFLFIVEALPAIGLGCIVIYWLADSPEQAWWLSEAERSYLLRTVGSDKQSPAHQMTVRAALSNPQVLKLSLIYFLWMTGYWGFNFYTPSILKGVGFANQQVGWLFAAAMTASLLVMLWVGHNSSRTGEKRWHGAVGMFLAAVGLIGGTLTPQPWLAFGFLTLAAIGVYSALGVWWSYPTTFLSGSAAAGAVGMINSLGSLGGFVGPFMTGWLKDTSGAYSGAGALLASMLIASGLMILSLHKRSK